MSKILIVSESDDEHVQVISERMIKRSVPCSWLQTDMLTEREGFWSIPNSDTDSECSWFDTDIRTVWYRKRKTLPAPTLDPVASFVQQEQEGFLASILLQYQHCRWVNSLASLAIARPKINQLLVAKRMGFQIPHTLVTMNSAQLRKFHHLHKGHVVVKPIQTQVVKSKEGSLVIGTRQLPLQAIEEAVAMTPCYAQERLEIDSEIRVVVFGERVFAFRMVPKAEADDLKQLELDQIEHSVYPLNEGLHKQIRALVAEFGLIFAACDFAIVRDGRLVFLEINPNGQWLWLQYMTGINLEDPFIDLLCER